MDRIEKIKEMMEQHHETQRPVSMIKNNLYSLATVIIISIAIVMYTKYLTPSKEQNKQAKIEQEKQQEYLKIREKQKELARKLNAKEYEEMGEDDLSN
jgi:short subunit fatty acids transporter